MATKETVTQAVLELLAALTKKDVEELSENLDADFEKDYAILLIGGMANSKFITEHITDRVQFIAPVVVLPGEREMESLCLTSYDALCGKEPIQQFVPAEV